MASEISKNHQLKSVGYFPRRILIENGLKTLTDDLFAFAVRAPTIYLLGSFRDGFKLDRNVSSWFFSSVRFRSDFSDNFISTSNLSSWPKTFERIRSIRRNRKIWLSLFSLEELSDSQRFFYSIRATTFHFLFRQSENRSTRSEEFSTRSFWANSFRTRLKNCSRSLSSGMTSISQRVLVECRVLPGFCFHRKFELTFLLEF